MPKFTRTKILATLGPASNSEEKIAALIEAGVDGFRFNFSHGTHEEHKEVYERVRRIAKKKIEVGTEKAKDAGKKPKYVAESKPFIMTPEEFAEFLNASLEDGNAKIIDSTVGIAGQKISGIQANFNLSTFTGNLLGVLDGNLLGGNNCCDPCQDERPCC